jgi:uncharacterized coiled-coil DUF342 family protein
MFTCGQSAGNLNNMSEKEPVTGNESFELEQTIVNQITELRKQLTAVNSDRLSVLNIGHIEKLSIDKKRELADSLNKVNSLVNEAQN